MTNYLNPSTYSSGAQQIVVPERQTASDLDDAPYDDEQYVRVNGEWEPLGTSFQTLSVEGVGDPPRGLTIYGTEFMDYLEQLPKGVLVAGNRNNSSTPTAAEAPVHELQATALRGRGYRLIGSGNARNDTAGQRSLMIMRYTIDGTTPDDTSPKLQDYRNVHGSANLILPYHISRYVTFPFDDVATFYGDEVDLRVLLAVTNDGGSGLASSYGSSTAPVELIIEDTGMAKEDTGIDRTGGSGPPPVTLKEYVKTFTSTTACCYMGNGAKDNSQGAEDMKQGYSSYDGDSESVWIFPPFTGPIGAASISKVRLYLYANHWSSYAGGSALIKRHNYAGVPSSNPSQTTVVTSSSWPRDAGRWVDITNASGVKSGIIGNTIKGFGVGPAGTSNQLYYGRFNKAGAKVEITYKR